MGVNKPYPILTIYFGIENLNSIPLALSETEF